MQFQNVLRPFRSRFFLAVVSLSFSVITDSVYGQIKSEEVDIVKAYQPLLADAVKIQFHAEPLQIDTTIEPLKYDVRQHVISLPFVPADIKPLALPQEPVQPSQNNLIKAGFGTQLSPLVEVYLGNGKSEKLNYGLDFQHRSSNGKDFQDYSYTGGSLFATSYFKSTALSGKLKYDRDVHYLYGGDSSFQNELDSITRNSLRQRFQNFGVDLGLRNTKQNKADIDYNLQFKFNAFDLAARESTSSPQKENFYQFDFALSKKILDLHGAHLDFGFRREEFSAFSDTAMNYFSILPNYRLNSKRASFKLGVNVDVVNKEVKLYPEIFASYKLIGEYLIPYVGFHGGSVPVTMQELVQVNPFISVYYPFTTELREAYGGVKGSYGNNILYNLRLSYADNLNVPFYLPVGTMPPVFSTIVYENARIINLHAEIGYRQSERLNLLLSGDASSYDLDFDDEPWGIPKSKVSLSANYNIQQKIIFNADVFLHSGAYTILPGDSVSTQLKGFADLNLGVTYNYKENIGFWLSFNNIASKKEREWYNYPYYGFQAMGGVILKF